MPQATILFAGLLTLLYLYLMRRVILARRKYRQAVGVTPEQPALLRATRAHGNFAEYTPLFLILLYLEESNFHTQWACYLLGGLFFAGRIAHAYSILVNEPRSVLAGTSVGQMLRFRFYAVIHTFMPMGILAGMLLVQWIMKAI